ncbi:protein ROLLING AND ERECT LEAF 2 [Lolium perenne]|uniref:protein ROLLING AND ERECT LEAF 2 n=1 Tax=Lolium perenne TaxID=4522 RepID=UPI0021F62A42|nr:protein ALTERED PHOSPHATE STARVATION RESPONSE 1-like [Lolium perenne]
MGCRSSRLDAADVSPVAALCRERRDLICAAGDRRAALAAAHAAYFRALPRVADALARFAHEHHAASPPGSPVLTLPPSEPDEPGAKKRSASSSTPHTDSGHSHLHFHSDSSDSDPDDYACDDEPGHGPGRAEIPPPAQHRQIPEPRPSRLEMPWDGRPEMPWEARQEMPWGHGPSYSSYPSSFPNVAVPSYHYMRASSAQPNTVYQEPYGYSNFATPSMPPSYSGYDYGYTNPMYGVPAPPESPAPAPPPPMPAAEVSPWDFFNPFDSYSQDIPHYNNGVAPNGSFSSSPNSSEVREREGIPDLEEETEHESMRMESLKARKAVESTASNRIDNVDVAAKVKVSMEHKECEIESVATSSVLGSGDESVCSCDCDNPNANANANAGKGGATPVGDDPGKVKRVSSDEHSSMVIGEDVAQPSFGTRDVAEVVEEIKEQFNSVVACGEDVARILEVGSIRYRPRNRVLKLIFTRMMGTIDLLFSSMSEPPLKNGEQSAISASQRVQNSSNRINRASNVEINTLSSIMDRLYVWEKRLHKEIVEEERLRITYDREWKRLKDLDNSGAEPYKIDATRASIRTLLTRINISIRSVKVISRRIHILRDDELHPYLVKLIQGHVTMWKFILECHKKQFHAILETKSHILIPKSGPETNSSKVTLELEMELLNWCSCFRNWIISQKAYIETLNGWLVKWLPEEKEETSDGIAPFSPGRLGAPGVFITANDWCQTMKRIPEDAVVDAMDAFAGNVHILWERQDEAQQQKMKSEYLSRDFAKRLKSHQKRQGLPEHPEVGKVVVPNAGNDRAVDSRMVALDALHTRLDEQRARHEETVKQIQESSATDLKSGLAPIFEALESFTAVTLKGYENVRIPTDSGRV